MLHRLAVQPRTVFGGAPCLRLSVYRYIGCNTLRLAVRADRTAVAFDENAPQVWLLRVQVGAQAALEFAERFNRLPVADQEAQVDVILAAHLAHQTFLHAMHARLGLGYAFDALAQGIESGLHP